MSLDPRLVVPYVTEQSPRGERTMDIYSRLLADRIIFIGMPVRVYETSHDGGLELMLPSTIHR